VKDILDIVDEIGVDLEKIGDKIWRGFCPFHRDTSTPNFTVYGDTDSWYCFACNMGGNILTLVRKFYNISQDEAWEMVYGKEVYSKLLERLKSSKEIFTFRDLINKTVSNIVYEKLKISDIEERKKILNVLKEFDVKWAKINNREEFNSLFESTLSLLQRKT